VQGLDLRQQSLEDMRVVERRASIQYATARPLRQSPGVLDDTLVEAEPVVAR
jgi:hypothetical protein